MSPLKLKNGRLHIGKNEIRIYLKDSVNQWKVFMKWSLLGILIIILGIIVFNKYFQINEADTVTQIVCQGLSCSQSGQKVAVTISPKELPQAQISSLERDSFSSSQPALPGPKEFNSSNPIVPLWFQPVVAGSQENPASPDETSFIGKFEEVLKANRLDEVEKYLEELKNPDHVELMRKEINLRPERLSQIESLYRTQIEHALMKNELAKAKNFVQAWKNLNPRVPQEVLKQIEVREILNQCHQQSFKAWGKGLAVECYKQVLLLDPKDKEAKAEVDGFYQKRVEQSFNELEKTKKMIQEWQKLNPSSSTLAKFIKQVELIELVQQCKKAFKRGHFVGKNSALECYEQVLYRDPNHQEAKTGVDSLYQKQVEQALTENNRQKALNFTQRWKKLNSSSPILSKALERIKFFGSLQRCKKLLSAGLLVGRKSALECYKSLRPQGSENEEIKRENEEIKRGMKEIERALQSQVEEALALTQKTLKKKHLNRAEKLLQNFEKAFKNSIVLPKLKLRFNAIKKLVEDENAKPIGPPPKETKVIPSPRPPEVVTPIPPPSPRPPILLPSRCTEIFVQESLGFQPLTLEQKEFKRIHCNPNVRN